MMFGVTPRGVPWTSRRTLLRALGWLLVAPMPLALASLVRRTEALASRSHDVVLPAVPADAVTFVDGAIVCRSGDALRVFSDRCTHLGCRIRSSEGDLLVCPCHGSRFRTDGTVAAGPAARPLRPLPHVIDPRTGALTVHVA